MPVPQVGNRMTAPDLARVVVHFLSIQELNCSVEPQFEVSCSRSGPGRGRYFLLDPSSCPGRDLEVTLGGRGALEELKLSGMPTKSPGSCPPSTRPAVVVQGELFLFLDYWCGTIYVPSR